MNAHKVVIIGAGPTGLGAGYRLKELGETDFCILEQRAYPGGLAASFQDDQGFWWDIGGHVQFSHYPYFDRLMDMLLPNQWLSHQRESWVWIADRFVPYPFQNNIHRLPQEMMQECLRGLIAIQQGSPTKPANFAEWILQTAGEGIAKHFLFPYNYKVWAHHPEQMNAVWVGERVAVTDLARVVANIISNTDDVSWGPNNTFRFPAHGGTGAIWNALAKKVGAEHIRLQTSVSYVDTAKKVVTLVDGEQIAYEHLVSTMPLDLLIAHSDLADTSAVATQDLLHSTTYIVGVGVQGRPKEELASKCWMYFPEDTSPFYRVTLFSHYAPANVPDPSTQFSLMTEVAASAYKPVDPTTVVADVIDGLYATKLLSADDKIISTWLHIEEHGYPTPSLYRDRALSAVQPLLMQRGIYSRGRFGMWKYEVSNQDHSLMQGVEAATAIMTGAQELTAWYPEVVNGPKPY